MDDVLVFAGIFTALCAVIALALVSARLTERLRIPTPAFFLIAAAVASDLFPSLQRLPIEIVQRTATVALVLILFDGGMSIGLARFRRNAGAITWLGVAGTLVTALAMAAAAHALFGLDWRAALLLGTALSPTDPAVVFSVLGQREVGGRTGVLLEGESGANDPVGIALMASLLTVQGTAGAAAFWGAAGEFALQMVVGAAVGLLLGTVLLRSMRRVSLPNEGLYPLRTLAAAGLAYGGATLLHGSGFLAVFVAGIVVGDRRVPYKREIEHFHSGLASLGEIVVFTVLGLTASVQGMVTEGAIGMGLVMAALMILLVRPVLVGLVLAPVRLSRNERMFVLWSGLKGAVPVLLGTYLLSAGIHDAHRLYGVVFVVVLCSVLVQGGLVPVVARLLRIPLRTVEPEPWTLGLRAQAEPEGLHRFRVAEGSPAAGQELDQLDVGPQAWVSLVLRGGELVKVRGSTRLAAGDEVIVMVEDDDADQVARLFRAPAQPA